MNTFGTSVILRLQNSTHRHSQGGSKVGSGQCGEFKSCSPHRSRRRSMLCSSPRHPWAASARTPIFLSQIDQQHSLFFFPFFSLLLWQLVVFISASSLFADTQERKHFLEILLRPRVHLPCSGMYLLLYLDGRVLWGCVERKSYLLTALQFLCLSDIRGKAEQRWGQLCPSLAPNLEEVPSHSRAHPWLWIPQRPLQRAG